MTFKLDPTIEAEHHASDEFTVKALKSPSPRDTELELWEESKVMSLKVFPFSGLE